MFDFDNFGETALSSSLSPPDKAAAVLLAMGRSQSDAASALRVSLGRTTVLEDIEALKRGLLALG